MNDSSWSIEREHILKALDRLENSNSKLLNQLELVIKNLNGLKLNAELDRKNIDILQKSNKSLSCELKIAQDETRKIKEEKQKYLFLLQFLGAVVFFIATNLFKFIPKILDFLKS